MKRSEWVLQSLGRHASVEREETFSEGVLEIGRHVEGFACPNDEQMADRHARLGISQGKPLIEDLETGSGIWIRIQGADGRLLVNNDQVWLGAQILILKHTLEGWQLRHHGPDGQLRGTHPIPEDGCFIGRTSTLVLDSSDEQLSRRHAQIVLVDGQPMLFDRGAHNGTYLRLSHPELLEDGSEFRLATQHFRVARAPSEAALAEEGSSEVTEVIGEARDGSDATVVSQTVEIPPSQAEPEAPRPALQGGAASAPPEADSSRRGPSLAARLRRLAEETHDSEVEDPDLVLVVIDSESGSISLEVEPGKTVLEAVQQAGLSRGEPVDWECGDGGCGVCVIGVVEGANRIDPPDPKTGEMKTIQITEQVAPDPSRYRLACLARVRGTVRLRKLT